MLNLFLQLNDQLIETGLELKIRSTPGDPEMNSG